MIKKYAVMEEEKGQIAAQLADIAVKVDDFKQASDTDDTQSFQRALDAGHRRLLLRNGANYNISSVNLPNAPVYIQGVNTYLGSTIDKNTQYIFNSGGSLSRLVLDGVFVNGGYSHRTSNTTGGGVDGGHYGVFQTVNGIKDTFSALNVANFAGQGLSNAPIGFIFHHYTDGIMTQMDNVGTGAILVLKNARNTNRRADKPDNYIGTGDFIRLERVENNNGVYSNVTPFKINNNARFEWNSVMTHLINSKADNGLWAFNLEATNEHNNFLNLKNGNFKVEILKDESDHTVLQITPTSRFKTIYKSGMAEYINIKPDDGFYGFSFTTSTAHDSAFAVRNGNEVELMVGKKTVDIGNLINLKAQTTMPTPRKGSIYFDGTNFKACKDGVTWQTIQLV